MNKVACQYAIIRFLPYAETGEFANVGVVLACPATGFFDAALMPGQRTRRIGAFFDQMDKRIYRDALRLLKDEIERLRALLAERVQRDGGRAVQQMFTGLVRPLEGLVRFGDTRVVMAHDPAMTLADLFGRYVERNFADRGYHDRLLEKVVLEALKRANVHESYKPHDIGNDFVHVKVPFVCMHEGRPLAAIKPLDLAKEEPNEVLDYGGHWLERVRRLKKHRVLPNMLFAVYEPSATHPAAQQAAREIVEELGELVVVKAVAEADGIAAFARNALRN